MFLQFTFLQGQKKVQCIWVWESSDGEHVLLVTVKDHDELVRQKRYVCNALVEWYGDHKDDSRNPPRTGKKRVNIHILSFM